MLVSGQSPGSQMTAGRTLRPLSTIGRRNNALDPVRGRRFAFDSQRCACSFALRAKEKICVRITSPQRSRTVESDCRPASQRGNCDGKRREFGRAARFRSDPRRARASRLSAVRRTRVGNQATSGRTGSGRNASCEDCAHAWNRTGRDHRSSPARRGCGLCRQGCAGRASRGRTTRLSRLARLTRTGETNDETSGGFADVRDAKR